MKSLTRFPRRRGFTLVEVMVVMAIVLILAGLALAAYNYATVKSKTTGTLSTMRAIQERLTDYFQEYGGYPTPANPDAKGNLESESWPTGGAMMLYQVMSADGNDQISGGDKPSTGQQQSNPDRKVLWPEVVAPVVEPGQTGKKTTTYVRATDEGTYVMVDSFKHPFMYRKAVRDRNGQTTNLDEMRSNAEYDLWSWGNLSKPTAEGGDPKDQGKWITSWNE